MTSGRVGPLRLALGWLTVVAVTATVTTTVVTRVGQDVAGELEQRLPSSTATLPSTTVTSTAGGTLVPGPTTTGPTRDPAVLPPPAEPGGTATQAPREASTGSAAAGAPTGPVVAGRSAGPPVDGDTGAGAPAPEGPSSTSDVPAGSRTTAQTGGRASTSPTTSFSAPGGSLTARCSDGQLQLRSVTPSNGYRYEVEREDGGLRATFKSDSREDGLLVTCRSGQPVLVLTGS